MTTSFSVSRVGIYVDVVNLARNGGYGMRYDVLREFGCRDGAEPVRLNAYVTFDRERATRDPAYAAGQYAFFSSLRDFGYKVIQKEFRWYSDEEGNRIGKANADLDLAVDALLQSERLDRVLLATGDGDFVRVVQALQNRSCRVEVVAFENVSSDLRRESDLFVSGYLIPNLLPMEDAQQRPPWGEIGSRVRGICYFHQDEKNYGFFRYMKQIAPGLWITDTREEESPYASAFFHDSNLPPEVRPSELPSRSLIFEFDLVLGERQQKVQATNIELVSPTRSRRERPALEVTPGVPS